MDRTDRDRPLPPIVVACPWCDGPVELESRAAALRCAACATEVAVTDRAPRGTRERRQPVAA